MCSSDLGPILFPFALWRAKKRHSSFIDWHGREAVRFQLFLLLWSALLIVPLLIMLGASVFLFGLPQTGGDEFTPSIVGIVSAMVYFGAAIVLLIAAFVSPIIAAVKASDGEFYCYRFSFSPRRKKLKSA